MEAYRAAVRHCLETLLENPDMSTLGPEEHRVWWGKAYTVGTAEDQLTPEDQQKLCDTSQLSKVFGWMNSLRARGPADSRERMFATHVLSNAAYMHHHAKGLSKGTVRFAQKFSQHQLAWATHCFSALSGNVHISGKSY